jgi:hypothetical protein
MDETRELIDNDAFREENRIVQRWREKLYLRAQAIARDSGVRHDGAVLITRTHYLQAAAEIIEPTPNPRSPEAQADADLIMSGRASEVCRHAEMADRDLLGANYP